MSSMQHWPLSSARLELRQLAADDAYLYTSLYTDSETMRFIGVPLTPRQARRSFQTALKCIDPPYGGPLFITIIERTSQLSVGLCAIQQIANGNAETGVMISAPARGRGIATESLRAVIGWSLATLPLDHVWVRIVEHNDSAARLVRSAGLVRQSPSANYIPELAPAEAIWTADRQTWRCEAQQFSAERFQPPQFQQEKTDARSRVP